MWSVFHSIYIKEKSMSIRIDIQYINYISNRLDLFKWLRPNLAVSRCPFCGDSESKKSKKRFYFYQRSSGGSLVDSMSCFCHNCGYAAPFGKWLSEFDSSHYNQYRTENFKDRPSQHRAKIVAKKHILLPVTIPDRHLTKKDDVKLATRCDALGLDHIARKYLSYRCILNVEDFWYSEDFKATATAFNNLSSLEGMNNGEPRLIIPFYDELGVLQCIQGRTLGDSKHSIKYLTVKRTEESKKIYGLHTLDKTKPIVVVEGPIDSMFLPNCLATADSNLLSIDYGDLYIPDNQFRNKQICKRIESIIAAGKNIVLFPSGEDKKDINAMIMDGKTKEEVWTMLQANVFKGLAAKLQFSRLRKC